MDENLPKPEKKAFLEARYTELEKEIATWSDLYNHLHARYRRFEQIQATGTFPPAALMLLMDTMFMYRAFAIALQDLPEEGDALVIAKRMYFIAVMQRDILGAEMTGEDATNETRVVYTTAEGTPLTEEDLKKLRGAAPVEEEENTMFVHGKKFLH